MTANTSRSPESASQDMSPEQFELFQDSIRIYPAEELIPLLDERIQACADDLLAAYTKSDADIQERQAATMNFGAAVMAQEPLFRSEDEKEEHSPLAPPAWAHLARLKLVKYIGKSPEERRVLMKTVFFIDDPQQQCNLGHAVSAAIKPFGNYDDLALGGGIVTGQVHTR